MGTLTHCLGHSGNGTRMIPHTKLSPRMVVMGSGFLILTTF